mmetsp:Transcript_28552/g.60253  ORF Transcript_28552/g.60253 Transcript_28552/m.60253 type:complete len:942 (-) Transcript_28552:75-2900(-)|eukprot:CAMPEP_0183730688 /NCGR_PEP_ID=MMETSP0737-20130205/33463_1 /TAXON_ID=385413 /ORGANISM="Thalassiosira miniscula, Strain CCMP1093" /LENGTH=941 /DNA_ID=CAMNT_0025963247 /DNA_START=214 /DNA_END=3039 /DNA_ORIENTATION=-
MPRHNAILAAILFGICCYDLPFVANCSLLPRGGGGSGRPSFIPHPRGGDSTKALDKDAIISQRRELKLSVDYESDNNEEEEFAQHSSVDNFDANADDAVDDTLYVTKKGGATEPLNKDKILQRLRNLSSGLDLRFLSLTSLAESILQGTYPNITTSEIDTLASETAASRSTQHPHYARLAARICATANHKATPNSFSEAMLLLNEGGEGFVNNEIADLVKRRGREIDGKIAHERDLEMSYFGYKTLERSYLLKMDEEAIVERPQYMWMRVALGIHCCKPSNEHNDQISSSISKEQEDANLEAAFETYDLMSRGYFTHASPTLFHAGTVHPQLCSCFLVQMSDDSINGIYDTLKRCAVISKAAGGIGLCVNKIRARGTFIKGTRGISNGLVPMLRVFDSTSHYVDQGGGKRPGAFAIYLEPWHADIFDVLNLRKNHGKEEQRARNLFYGLWVPDLFMKRVEEDGMWSLMCPHECPGLAECHGDEFEQLYEKYESEGRYKRQVRARSLWAAILDAQIETGTPYLLYKDAANRKSNQKNLGTIQCSNLCTEIIQYTDEEEVAVCNLASICLSKFVVSEKGGTYGSTKPGQAYFDHEQLHKVAKIITRNLDKVIDVNQYPIEGAKKSNRSHRPIGIGVSGLADAFLRLGLPFSSKEAQALNEAIFETIYHASLEASNEIAQEKGSYSTFDGSPASMGKLQFNLWGVSDDETPSRRLNLQRGDSINNDNLQKYSKEVEETGYDWDNLRHKIVNKGGLRNSLLVAPMPTASTSQILGVNECFEPFASNLYVRRVKAGEFIIVNPHLIQDLTDLGLWNQNVRNQLMRDGGSVAKIDCIPDHLKELYKTVWEIKMKDIIDMAAGRGKFIDQSQSLNLFMAVPTANKLTAMHFYAWKKGLKTGIYYLRTRPAVNAIQFTVSKTTVDESDTAAQANNIPQLDDSECLSCSA